jgi:hypothetical protein
MKTHRLVNAIWPRMCLESRSDMWVLTTFNIWY